MTTRSGHTDTSTSAILEFDVDVHLTDASFDPLLVDQLVQLGTIDHQSHILVLLASLSLRVSALGLVGLVAIALLIVAIGTRFGSRRLGGKRCGTPGGW